MILAFRPLFSQTVTGFDNITDIQGNTHSLSAYLDDNKYVLLNFYLETCGNCMATAPLIESIYQNYGQNECNIVVLSFIIDNQAPFPTNNDCENWAINNGMTGPPNFNYTEADWYQFYSNHGGGFAQTYLVSPYGDSVIYAHAGGVLNYNNIESLLNDISLEINASIIQEENLLNVIVENDNLNYVFEWNTGENTQQITPSYNGDYWVIISDQNNCVSDTLFINFQSVNTEKTFVPDDNFEQNLINLGYDDVLDDSVLTNQIESITSLYLFNPGIIDLTGIEDFENLQILECEFNQLTHIDISENLELVYLDVSSNNLTEISVDENLNLAWLDVGYNNLTEINVSENYNLQVLYCNNNQINNIDVSSNPNLVEFGCFQNNLTNIDISQNYSLNWLSLINNPYLSCIEVWDINYAYNNFLNIDEQHFFSLECDDNIYFNCTNLGVLNLL